ncbi:hypothetical protein QNH03_gp42 [Escherichia phage vB_EcoM_Bp10]|uniref:hypothetical protein n=1 Tax=Escherichia phage vB_EcoM_Bp10 TaxID=2593324 RepID=UPI0024AD0D60|nr:hypothetical protein QNH03_gp42 [Escherichia phage vB_EcoM_Bp10]QEM42540.1 hypothetical protein vBEcoMBp10_42 [Escherichia phage vB_EcoM_Bp10]
MDFIVFFKLNGVEQRLYFNSLLRLQEWAEKFVGYDFEYINACTTDEHEEIVFSSLNQILEAK